MKLAAAQDIKTDDWSEAVSPFWQAVIQSALSVKGIGGLLKAGWTTIKVHVLCYHASKRGPLTAPACAFHQRTIQLHL